MTMSTVSMEIQKDEFSCVVYVCGDVWVCVVMVGSPCDGPDQGEGGTHPVHSYGI